ncbi:hypothetical protein ATERTT37_001351 [Aspergillus terreus]|jgi:hypothetical protein
MYSYTPTHKFLVLAPIQSGPRSIDITSQPELTSEQALAAVRERSDSQSSTATAVSQTGDVVSSLPSGFLYLGHDTNGKN